MILLTHILIALASIAHATVTLFVPSSTQLKISCLLVAATLTSGCVLVASTQTHILQACVTGLVYLAGVSAAIVLAYFKLAHAKNNN